MSDLLLPDKIQETIKVSGITDLNLAESIASHFVPFMSEITEQTDKLKGLELGNKEHAEIAKRVNIDLGKIRSRKDAVKKEQKDYFLKVGRFIDAIANVNEGAITLGQENAQTYSKYFERIEAERIAKLKEERNALMSQYSEITIPNLEILPEEVFEKMLANYKLAHEAKLKAEKEAEEKRLEDERVERERQTIIKRREEEIKPLYSFFEVPAMQILGDLTEEEYQEKLSKAKQSKLDYEAEQERIRLENERLKKETEEKEKQLRKEREEALAKQREIEAKVKAEAEARAKKEQEEARLRAIEEAKKQAEIDRIQKELAAEKQRQADKEAAEKKVEEDRIKAEAELLKSGDKKRLQKWVSDMAIMEIKKEGLSAEGEDLANEISLKFESFKNWAVKQVEKM